MSKKTVFSAFAIILYFALAHPASARDRIRIVGSSTVYPFSSAVAEELGKHPDFETPIVESTGTGGGFKIFCSNADLESSPDIEDASRAIKKSERERCNKNGINNIIELKLGTDGIAFANSVHAPLANFSTKQIFLALARQVPVNGKLIDNPYQKWSDIDPSLPNTDIEVYGPPSTSGTRDAFVDIIMEKGCESFPEFKKAYPDIEARHKACKPLREDGKFIEAGEDDNLIVQKLSANHDAFGLFGFSYLEQNGELIQGSLINNVEPTFETIANRSYTMSRPLFIYIKGEHLGKIPGIREFVEELLSDHASGQDGYLVYKGLVPLPVAEHKAQREKALKLVK